MTYIYMSFLSNQIFNEELLKEGFKTPRIENEIKDILTLDLSKFFGRTIMYLDDVNKFISVSFKTVDTLIKASPVIAVGYVMVKYKDVIFNEEVYNKMIEYI